MPHKTAASKATKACCHNKAHGNVAKSHPNLFRSGHLKGQWYQSKWGAFNASSMSSGYEEATWKIRLTSVSHGLLMV